MRTYIVKAGDTLSDIARRAGVTLTALRQVNPQLTNIDRIFPGQSLNIPDEGPHTDTTAEPIPSPSSSPTAPDFRPLTAQQLCAIVPTLSQTTAATLIDPLNQAMQWADINTPAREAAFLAQVAHETGGFRWFRELGSDAYFERYQGRIDLGNTQPGDGVRFKGRGFIQITGRTNYQRAGEALGIDLIDHPQLAETPAVGARIAAWYWQSHDLNRYADRGDFITITRRINGGLNGLADREAYYERAERVLRSAWR
jgi:predicted chitinase